MLERISTHFAGAGTNYVLGNGDTLFVDAASTVPNPDGSILRPYPSIQQAINTIPVGVDSATIRRVWTIVVIAGTYNEDLNIDITRRKIVIAGLGPWNLGEFNAADWGPSGVRRNINISSTLGPIDGIRPGLAIMNYLPISEGLTTHQSYLTRPRISGKISFITLASTLEFALMAEVFGDGAPTNVSIDMSPSAPTGIETYIYSARLRGRIQGSNCLLQVAEKTRFDGLVDIAQYSLIRACRINAGMVVVSAANAGIFPQGLIDTYFTSGTFTGPAGSIRCNGNTNYWIKTNGVILAGGATKVIQDDLVP